jgi:acylphosphatase
LKLLLALELSGCARVGKGAVKRVPARAGKMAAERREIWYRGQVQGVGFRYTVAHLARRYPVSGFVRNAPDGRVQLVCEGAVEEIDQFVAAIAARMQPFIRETQEDRRPASTQYHGFEIRH